VPCGRGRRRRDWLRHGYHSYIVTARFSADDVLRAYAEFTVYRYRYSATPARTEYSAGEIVSYHLAIEDVCDPLGPRTRSRTRLRPPGLRRDRHGARNARTDAGAEASLAWTVPANALSGQWTVEVLFDHVVLQDRLSISGAGGLDMHAGLIRAWPDGVDISVQLASGRCAPVFVDYRTPSTFGFARIDVAGCAALRLPRPDPARPMEMIALLPDTDGIASTSFLIEPCRPRCSWRPPPTRPPTSPVRQST